VQTQTPHARVLTPPGQGGIGIVAVCGPGAAALLDRVFVGTRRTAAALLPGAIAHGTIQRDGSVLDEVIVARLDGPGEARFEVNCHGGIAAVLAVLDCLRGAGADLADWQDVTPPAPLPGPPLAASAIRAAALAELPRVPTRLGAVMLLHQAEGALRTALEGVTEALEGAEAARLDDLLATAPLGAALLGPPRVALIGPPNVGKSTLLNALLEQERVIVHEEPGTTRDTVVERVSLRGVPFDLMDAAGIRATGDDVEEEAVRRALRMARTCDVALLLFDAREGAWPEPSIAPDFGEATRVVAVGNKADLLAGPPPAVRLPGGVPPGGAIYVSARNRTNLNRLEDALLTPYEALIEPCRSGAAVVFRREIAEVLAAAREAARHDSPAAALQLLHAAGL
jgi:tRNA modification GTPase